jgi:hypothetical protein
MPQNFLYVHMHTQAHIHTFIYVQQFYTHVSHLLRNFTYIITHIYTYIYTQICTILHTRFSPIAKFLRPQTFHQIFCVKPECLWRQAVHICMYICIYICVCVISSAANLSPDSLCKIRMPLAAGCQYVCVCVYMRESGCVHIYIYIYIYHIIFMCVCTCMGVYIYTHIHTYIHTYRL